MRIIQARRILGEVSPFKTFLVGPVTNMSDSAHTDSLDMTQIPLPRCAIIQTWYFNLEIPKLRWLGIIN